MLKRAICTVAALLLSANAWASNRLIVSYGPASPIPAAGTVLFVDPFAAIGNNDIDYIAVQGFLDFGSAGGTTITAYLQTTLDDGLVWQDVCAVQVLAADVTKLVSANKYLASTPRLTASDGALAVDTCAQGFFATKWRVKIVIAGTYAADSVYRLHVDWQKLR